MPAARPVPHQLREAPQKQKGARGEPVHCERVQWRSEETPATIKRQPAQIRYNSPPWIWQPQQLRQRLNPRRRIQSSGTSTRDANMTSGANIAGIVKAPASASMTSNANGARSVAAPVAYASTERDAPDARSVAVPAYASTASGTTNAPIVRTSRAPWKDVHCSAIVFALPKSC